MLSFFSKLFGSAESQKEKVPNQGNSVEYQGLIIRSAPIAEGGQWRVSGVIIKQFDGALFQRDFVRADVVGNREEAEVLSVRKGKQIIDEQGDKLFDDGVKTGRV